MSSRAPAVKKLKLLGKIMLPLAGLLMKSPVLKNSLCLSVKAHRWNAEFWGMFLFSW